MQTARKTVVLNIGLHEAGLIYIQNLLAANRDRLPGWIEVASQADGSSRPLHKACQALQVDRHKGGTAEAPRTEILDACQALLQRAGDKRVLLVSDSDIAGLLPGRLNQFRLYPSLAEIATTLAEGFAGHEVIFVLYVRDVEPWIAGVYNRAVRYHRVQLDYEGFRKAFDGPILMGPVVKALQGAVGEERVRVIALKDDMRQASGLGTGLLQVAGLSEEEISRLSPPNFQREEPLSPRVLELVRAFNKTDIEAGQMQALVEILQAKSGLFTGGEREKGWPVRQQPEVALKIDRIFYINLDTRPDRQRHMERILQDAPAPVERVSGVMLDRDPEELGLTMIPQRKGQRGPAGIWLAHKAVLQRALETEGDGAILLLEDDLWLTKNFWVRDFTVPGPLPENWDILMLTPRLRSRTDLGTGYFAPMSLNRPMRLNLLPFIASGAHFLIFRNRAAVRRVLENLDRSPMTDVDLHYVAELETYGVTRADVTAGGFGSDH